MPEEILEPEVVEWLAYGNAYALARRLASPDRPASTRADGRSPSSLAEEVARRLDVIPAERRIRALVVQAVEDALAGRRPRL